VKCAKVGQMQMEHKDLSAEWVTCI
jgi:hypothetical protein